MYVFISSLLKGNIEASGIKVINLMRNPKDVIVSSFHASKYFMHVSKEMADVTFEQTLEFMSGDGDRGNLLDFNRGYWEQRYNPRFLNLFFEEVRRDYHKAVRTIARFMKKELTDDQVDDIVKFIDFEAFRKHQNKESLTFSMRNKEVSNGHVRKGDIGEWKTYFTVAQNEQYDRLIAEKFRNDPIPFEFEI